MEKNDRCVSLHCFNPLEKVNHSCQTKGLRTVAEWMCTLFPEMPKIAQICDSCRKQLGTLRNKEEVGTLRNEEVAPSAVDAGENTGSDSNQEPTFTSQPQILQSLNTCLQELGESPVNRKKIAYKRYSTGNRKKMDSAMKRKLFVNAESSESDDEAPDNAIVNNLKTKFTNSSSRKKKIMILTCLPESWSVRKIMHEFNAPNYMVRQAKQLLQNRGILESPDQKPGKSLLQETAHAIRSFYESDDISRVMPGIKDCVSMKDSNGQKIKVSKRLVLCNLMEAYRLFKENFRNMPVSFSKFAELWPKNCILTGPSGTHMVCVCTIHQNLKLMIENGRLTSVTSGEIQTYKHCLAKVLCNPASLDCHLGNCNSCPGNQEIKTILEKAFEENLVENITFRQWISVDRCKLETLQKSTLEFIDLFCNKLSMLVRHDFIVKQQSSFMKHIKENLQDSQFAVYCDFSENYSFLIQDEVQSYHWTIEQATVHPFVVYYKGETKTEHVSYVVISDCLEHNTVAVYSFQKKLIDFLRKHFNEPKKIYYFSDGAAAQYKNKKNFLNLCFHEADFGIEAEWHFSATAHGKGPCDGVGGTVKRLAARASLQHPYDNHILTPRQLFNWAVENISAVHFTFVSQQDYIETVTFLNDRFSKALTIPGTQKFHAFIPVVSDKTKIFVKIFSYATSSFEHLTTKPQETLSLSGLSGYITVVYNNKWWLAYVLEKDEEEDEVKVTFLYPSGSAPSFAYPEKPDVLWIRAVDVLCKVNPVTPTGRIYTLPENDMVTTNRAFTVNSNLTSCDRRS